MTATEIILARGLVLSLYRGQQELWWRKFATLEACREYLAANKAAPQCRYSLPRWQWLDADADPVVDPHGPEVAEISRLVFTAE